MKISLRLLTIANLIKEGAFVADVGADHGLLEKYLIDNNKVNCIQAIENKIGPFTSLKNNLVNYKNVILSLSEGITDLDKRVNTIVLAGMGGHLIIDILENDLSKLTNIKQIIVDPHRDIDFVKEKIISFGFKIEEEKNIVDVKRYTIISFIKE